MSAAMRPGPDRAALIKCLPMSETMTMNAPLTAADGETLKVKLARERRNKQLKAIALVAPLALFLLLTRIS